jgi:sarcosine oxidase gamma subunit
MADRGDHSRGEISVDGLSVQIDRAVCVTALRYFGEHRAATAIVQSFTGAALPAPLAAVAARGGRPPWGQERRNHDRWILAWRSPTETWLLCAEEQEMAELHARIGTLPDACAVDQTGGIAVLRVRGERAADMLLRLGSTASVPAQGEARTSRVAELAVTALRVQADEMLLLLDQAYADHLLGWIAATARDLP